jgi:hypothetical protein
LRGALLLWFIKKGECHFGVISYGTMKISHPVGSIVKRHRIVRPVPQWMAIWGFQMLNSFVLRFFNLLYIAGNIEMGANSRGITGRSANIWVYKSTSKGNDIYTTAQMTALHVGRFVWERKGSS